MEGDPQDGCEYGSISSERAVPVWEDQYQYPFGKIITSSSSGRSVPVPFREEWSTGSVVYRVRVVG